MKKVTFIAAFILIMAVTSLDAGFTVDIEAGAVFSGYNDVRIPGKGEATKFSLSEELESDPVLSYRITLRYLLNERHQFSLLYAPLQIKPKGKVNREIVFQEKIFPPDTELTALYRFDSYRLQYRYHFQDQGIIRAAGATIKLRDAEIALSKENESAKKTNTGFVPLINLLLIWDLSPKLSVIADGEGLWSPFGRAADIFTGFAYNVDDRYSFTAGYRILEGGSDGDEVYTFALLNYLVVGMRLSF